MAERIDIEREAEKKSREVTQDWYDRIRPTVSPGEFKALELTIENALVVLCARVRDAGWVDVKEGMPDNSEVVLITDGVNLSTAHWFEQRRKPRTNELLGGAWVNQHFPITGRVTRPTHWMKPTSLSLPIRNGEQS